MMSTHRRQPREERYRKTTERTSIRICSIDTWKIIADFENDESLFYIFIQFGYIIIILTKINNWTNAPFNIISDITLIRKNYDLKKFYESDTSLSEYFVAIHRIHLHIFHI